MLRKLQKLKKTCFEGEVTAPKVIFWLLAVNCLLAGIVCGLLCAPLTHGVMIGSNNGNCNNGNCGCPEAEDEDGRNEEEEA